MKILLFTKSEKIIKKYKKAFSELSYWVHAVTDKEEMDILNNLNRYDLAILYINDLLDFLDIIERLRVKSKKIYILAIYRDINIDLKLEGYYIGVDDYFPAKKTVNELAYKVRAIERMLNRYTFSLNENILKFKDIVLNIDNREVTRNGHLIKLSNKEYRILEYFMKNTNKILTRNMIAEKIWDISYSFNSNIVDVYITNIRKKINKNNSVKLITTVRGVGYILKD